MVRLTRGGGLVITCESNWNGFNAMNHVDELDGLAGAVDKTEARQMRKRFLERGFSAEEAEEEIRRATFQAEQFGVSGSDDVQLRKTSVSGSGRGVGGVFSVSSASEGDVAAVHELMMEWEEEAITIGHDACDVAYLRDFLDESFFVARESRRIAGFVCARIVHGPGYAVMPAAQRVLASANLPCRSPFGSVPAVTCRAKSSSVAWKRVISAARPGSGAVRYRPPSKNVPA